MRRGPFAVALLSAAAFATFVPVHDAVAEVRPQAVALQLDNDLFTGAHRDEDYSWGLAITWARTLEPDEGDWRARSSALQIGVQAMTPESLRSHDPIPGERPFASLVYLTSAQLRTLDDAHRARYSAWTLGALGLKGVGSLHRQMHRVIANHVPMGWENQVSAGGELTGRYHHAEQWLLGDGEADTGELLGELKLSLTGSVGYLTEAGVALTTRWGRTTTPWWSFNPELADYAAAPVLAGGAADEPEWFLFAGVRLKARAYNAFLQGQFRDSVVTISSGDVERLQAEGWAGFAASRWGWRMVYSIRYATPEISIEPGSRTLLWAGVSFEKTF